MRRGPGSRLEYRRVVVLLLLMMVPMMCSRQEDHVVPAADGTVPAWAADAVWYQVYVSRFCNGDTSNDPSGVLPWTDDWARLLPGESPPLRERLFYRRYGGDLAGVRRRLPYLQDLGVNALYLNPVFQAPSEHKYDTEDYRHVDDSFGVADSRSKLSSETDDPASWQWSESDRVFLDFLADAHNRGIRVVVDGVFNHVGRQFHAWRDVQARGRGSRYADWFAITNWGPPLQWQAWDRPNGDLPKFKRVGDGLHPEVEAYLLAVVRRWQDPDGDGDPSDGVDGWRLDAADEVPLGFWRRFRAEVKRINPNAIIVGEIWSDARLWLQGDAFDVVTNYRFSDPVLRFFTQDNRLYDATAFVEDLDAARLGYPPEVVTGLINLLDSHDTERAVTALTDPQRHVSSRAGLPARIPERDTLIPDEDAYRRLKLAVALQFTYPGAPIIYYGNEVGMFGGDDPFCRAPMWWTDNESRPGRFRSDLTAWYRRLIELRGRRVELRRGGYELILADDARRLAVFRRVLQNQSMIVLVNADDRPHPVVLPMDAAVNLEEFISWSTKAVGDESPKPALTRGQDTVQVRSQGLSANLLLMNH
jgi:glycosidase